MTEKPGGCPEAWDETDSEIFSALGRYVVPERELQIRIICDMIASVRGACHIVELCSGEGLLSRALLERFPEALVHCFDGSATMLAATRRATEPYADRVETREFDLAERAWRRFDWPLHAVVSSLAIHHLDGPAKRALYRDMAQALAPGGALVVADLVAPAEEMGKRLAVDIWDQEVRRQAMAIDGHLAAFERFQETRWNLFSDPDPDPVDRPSPLLDQLLWMRQAGLVAVDVYWMKAGHAVFGGKKPGP